MRIEERGSRGGNADDESPEAVWDRTKALDAVAEWHRAPFTAPPWGTNPHVQTLAGKVLRRPRALGLERMRWATPDGDELLLDVHDPPELSASGSPLVVVLHGLEGSARRPYCRLLYGRLAERGIAAVGLNFRGCGGEPNHLPRAYHSGETGDFAFVLERLRATSPDRVVGAIGFSLGGNVLLKFLAEHGAAADRLLSAAAAISVPFDLDAGASRLEASFMGRRYAHYFLASLKAKIVRKRRLLEELVDVDEALRAPTIRAFDDLVTAPLHGFRDASEYYRLSSSGPRVGEVRIPTLIIHALDDPFLPARCVPVDAACANPWIHLVISDRGGHVGFVGGAPWKPLFWSEACTTDFLGRALDAGR